MTFNFLVCYAYCLKDKGTKYKNQPIQRNGWFAQVGKWFTAKDLPILERNIIVHRAAWRYLIVGMVASVVGIAACIGCLIRWIVR